MVKKTCKGCGAKCCRYIATEIDKPESKKDYQDIVWYLLHENVWIFIEEGKWYIQFNTDCKKLDENSKCSIYEKRPKICRDLDIESCERYGDGEAYDFLFKEPEEFIDYLKKKGKDTENLEIK
ncbi:YkgJ family cysteine cluster protein [Candidatus Pacearchaeota archaeon]|nr:YkgJ family cysteine cluster protein [Candidatus Pacearchaeota archaeon]MBD3283641.1 YkgJ family cysteine cluster protein [Candidatus Pacearchaeota archaeon]